MGRYVMIMGRIYVINESLIMIMGRYINTTESQTGYGPARGPCASAGIRVWQLDSPSLTGSRCNIVTEITQAGL